MVVDTLDVIGDMCSPEGNDRDTDRHKGKYKEVVLVVKGTH